MAIIRRRTVTGYGETGLISDANSIGFAIGEGGRIQIYIGDGITLHYLQEKPHGKMRARYRITVSEVPAGRREGAFLREMRICILLKKRGMHLSPKQIAKILNLNVRQVRYAMTNAHVMYRWNSAKKTWEDGEKLLALRAMKK